MPTCSVCGQNFATEQELQRHGERMHPGMMSGRSERVGERMPIGTTREEKKMGKLEEKEAKYKEKEGEHEAKGPGADGRARSQEGREGRGEDGEGAGEGDEGGLTVDDTYRNTYKRVAFDPETVLKELQQQSTLPMTPTDVGMGSSLEAAMPTSLFAPNVPSATRPQSDIGIGPKTDAMLGNRHDADEESLNKLDTTQRWRKYTHHVCIST